MRVLSTILLTISSITMCFSQHDDRTILTNLKHTLWPKAYMEQDTLLLGRILAEEFQMIDSEGRWFTKRDELEYISKNKPSYDSFRYDIKRLEIFDDHTAIIAGEGTIIYSDDNSRVVSTYQSSNILIKRNGTWKAISSHVSGIKRKQ